MKYCPECGTDLSRYRPSHPETPRVSEPEVAAVADPEPQIRYDQDAIWTDMHKWSQEILEPPTADKCLRSSNIHQIAKLEAPVKMTVHMMFDRDIVPTGGFLYRAVMSDGRLGANMNPKLFEAAGYTIKDGKVQMEDGVPVGKAWRVIRYWGGQRQYKRWHLSDPVTLNPGRNGNPYFMDNNMVAFGTSWSDTKNMLMAFRMLLERFHDHDGELIAVPTLVHGVVQ